MRGGGRGRLTGMLEFEGWWSKRYDYDDKIERVIGASCDCNPESVELHNFDRVVTVGSGIG